MPPPIRAFTSCAASGEFTAAIHDPLTRRIRENLDNAFSATSTSFAYALVLIDHVVPIRSSGL